MAYKVFVDGQEGTTGLRIHEVLAGRSDVEVLRIDPDKRKDAGERARLLNAADVAFLCLPDAAAREAAFMVTSEKTCLIDASTAHRTAAGWVFGMPELTPGQRESIRQARRISNPGCHASAFILLLRPLVDAGLVPKALPVSATSITGYSGGGKKMIEQYQAGGDDALDGTAPLRPDAGAQACAGDDGAHRAGDGAAVHADRRQLLQGPVGAGAAAPVAARQAGTTPEQLHEALAARYADERFVRVMPLRDARHLEAGFFDVQACNDSNRVDLFVFANDQQALLVARLDNLGKGASGAAVQSMNVHLGVDEGLGL